MAAPAKTLHEKLGKNVWLVRITQSGANNGNVDLDISEPLSSMSIQVEGRSAATIDLQGSNNNVDFYALPTAVQLTADGIKSVAAVDLSYRYYRVAVTGAGAGDNMVINIVAKLL
jgi:hypothetical protein